MAHPPLLPSCVRDYPRWDSFILFYSLKLFTYLIIFHYATFGGVHGIGAFHPVAIAFVAFALLVPAEDMRVEISTKI
jgi:hypothetical protein